jgi:hypothetical protein
MTAGLTASGCDRAKALAERPSVPRAVESSRPAAVSKLRRRVDRKGAGRVIHRLGTAWGEQGPPRQGVRSHDGKHLGCGGSWSSSRKITRGGPEAARRKSGCRVSS